MNKLIGYIALKCCYRCCHEAIFFKRTKRFLSSMKWKVVAIKCFSPKHSLPYNNGSETNNFACINFWTNILYFVLRAIFCKNETSWTSDPFQILWFFGNLFTVWRETDGQKIFPKNWSVPEISYLENWSISENWEKKKKKATLRFNFLERPYVSHAIFSNNECTNKGL